MQCSGCGVLRTEPGLSESELAAFYPSDYWGAENDPTQEWIVLSQSEKVHFLKECRLSSGRVLDVGCGSGFFLRALPDQDWDRNGVEISERAARAAERALGPGRICCSTLLEAGYPDSSFDLITMWSSLEHTNQPRKTLREARRVLKPGGSLIVQVPNAKSYQFRLFGKDWFALDVPRHRYHFTLASLDVLLSDVDFAIYHKTFFSPAHNAHALRQSLKSRLSSNGLGKAIFVFSIPLIKPVDWLMSARGSGATLTVAARAL